MNWTIVGAAIVAVASCIGSIISTLINRRPAHISAQAEERKATSADWQAYSASVNTWAGGLLTRLEEVERRLETAELHSAAADTRSALAEKRALAAEARADRSEKLYKLAINYLTELAGWVQQTWTGDIDNMPTPPPELEADL